MSGDHDSRDRGVQAMFDRIAGRYDLLNRVISFRLDKHWRHRVIEAAIAEGNCILDIGTGTGDLIYEAAKTMRTSGRLIGLDFSPAMLRLAHAKRIESANNTPSFILGSAMLAPFKNSVFDSAMTAFVLRNVSDLSLLFTEAYRVLKNDGTFVSLDMFPPRSTWFSSLYGLYFHRFMPHVGGWLSGDRQAYRYLSESVRGFHSPERVADLIRDAGFDHVVLEKFLGGAVCMHIARKRSAGM